MYAVRNHKLHVESLQISGVGRSKERQFSQLIIFTPRCLTVSYLSQFVW